MRGKTKNQMSKKSKTAKNKIEPLFIENQWFESPEAHTVFCLNRAANMTSQEKHVMMAEKLENRTLFGLGVLRENFGIYYQYED